MVKEKGDRREMIVSCQRWGGRLSSRDVRYWHKADIGLCSAHVCCGHQTGFASDPFGVLV